MDRYKILMRNAAGWGAATIVAYLIFVFSRVDGPTIGSWLMTLLLLLGCATGLCTNLVLSIHVLVREMEARGWWSWHYEQRSPTRTAIKHELGLRQHSMLDLLWILRGPVGERSEEDPVPASSDRRSS